MPLPAPDGPVTTKTGREGTARLGAVVEEVDELGALALGEAADGLRLADPAWLSSRAAFTRPNLGTAMSMSKTFAVETNSGGVRRICSMWTRPALRSRLSCARRTRTSFALWSASIRWSSERAGAWACVFDVTMSRTSLAPSHSASSGNFSRNLQVFLSCLICRLDDRPRSAVTIPGSRARSARPPAASASSSSSRRTLAGAAGSEKRTVPSATALAPTADKVLRVGTRARRRPCRRWAPRRPTRRRGRRRGRSASGAGPE